MVIIPEELKFEWISFVKKPESETVRSGLLRKDSMRSTYIDDVRDILHPSRCRPINGLGNQETQERGVKALSERLFGS